MKRRTKALWRRRFDAGLTLLMVTVSAVALWSFWHRRSPGAQLPETALPAGPVQIEGLLEKGHPDSTAAVILFSDFQCPFCATFVSNEMQALDKDVAGAGLALIEFANFPLEAIHPLARVSAEAMECARHEQLGWQMHDLLFGLSASGRLRTRTDVDSAIAATSTGDSQRRIAQCVSAGRENSRITAQTDLAHTLGVQSTPTFVIGRRKGPAFYPRKRIKGITSASLIAHELQMMGEDR